MISNNFKIASNYQHISILPIKEKMALKIHDELIISHFTQVLYSANYYKAIYNETIDYIWLVQENEKKEEIQVMNHQIIIIRRFWQHESLLSILSTSNWDNNELTNHIWEIKEDKEEFGLFCFLSTKYKITTIFG